MKQIMEIELFFPKNCNFAIAVNVSSLLNLTQS